MRIVVSTIKRLCIFQLMGAFLVTLPFHRAAAKPVDTSGLLFEEVLSASDDPKAFDWFQSPLTVGLTYGVIQESNSFESRSYGVEAARSVFRGLLARVSVRRVTTEETESARMLSLTPFTQAGQPSRYEFLGGVAYTLIEGRGRTALSPKITDIGHGLQGLLGLQYNSFSEGTLQGMRAVRPSVAAEWGFRYQILLPLSLGLAFEWTSTHALVDGDPDLGSWQRVGGGLSWSFGR